jgi:hypothetical protein
MRNGALGTEEKKVVLCHLQKQAVEPQMVSTTAAVVLIVTRPRPAADHPLPHAQHSNTVTRERCLKGDTSDLNE